MAVQKILHPFIGFAVFMIGMTLGITVHFYFAILSIVGGLMLGFSSLRNDLPCMSKKAKWLFYGTFIFFTLLFSSAIFVVDMFMG